MNITKEIVLKIEKDTNCPILEMFYTKDDGYWYVCFEEDIVINGKDQIVHLDDVINKIQDYDNIEFFTNEVYEGDEEDSFFEQITFQWKE